MSQAVSTFVSDLLTHFPKRFESESAEDQWLDSMYRNLRGYGSGILSRACQRIIDTRTDRSFPLPAEIRKVCDEIEKIEKAEQQPKFDDKAQEQARIKDHDWRSKLADDLIMCSLGKRAANEGWILSLHDFCRLNGRLPTKDFEISGCIQAARGFDRAYEAVLNGEGGVCAKSLEKLGDSMLRKREDLRARVLGREAA